MDEAMIQALRIKRSVMDWLITQDENSFILFAVGAAILILLALGYTLHKGKKVPGEEAMNKEQYVISKRQRKQRIHTLIADGVADLLLDLLTKGELNSDEYKRWHLRFGTQLALKDLLPQPLTPELLKASMKKKMGNGVYKPVYIPGPPVKKVHHKNKLEEILASVK